MAASLRRFCRPCLLSFSNPRRTLVTNVGSVKSRNFVRIGGSAVGAILSVYVVYKAKNPPRSLVTAKEPDGQTKAEARSALIQTQRELRFLSFASVEFEGNIYMTPQDFLESVTEEIPRPRSGRRRMDRYTVEKMLKNTPTRRKGSPTFFRNLHEKGLISYTEYLFLLCVLTKPRSGFQIAFNMFDTDGNQRVDKQEFLVVIDVIKQGLGAAVIKETDVMPLSDRSNIWKLLQTDPSDGTVGAPLSDTTLTVHFFGQRGKDNLKYEDFHRFMENLQTEVLELEFNEFSRGMTTISEEEFAHILLRYTILSPEETEDYLERLRSRIPESKGITFSDFKEFGQFLNNLDDFALAMRIYTFGDNSISESDFSRAVKAVTGFELNDHLVHVVFQLFDQDGDGKLSHKEFISVMKDRLHRGFKSSLIKHSRWDEFKTCVKREIKNS